MLAAQSIADLKRMSCEPQTELEAGFVKDRFRDLERRSSQKGSEGAICSSPTVCGQTDCLKAGGEVSNQKLLTRYRKDSVGTKGPMHVVTGQAFAELRNNKKTAGQAFVGSSCEV
jgi:hypothetical protein